jgi:flavin reductase (DIM6/NTAB) family NADH-FMN oxidoreductase RutF
MVFYEPGKTDHNLPHDPFKSCVIPRPIGWISTTSADGKTHNLAPYSQFNNLTFDPPYVMFSANQTQSSQRKDTVVNAEMTGKFCWNLATWKLREHVNISAEQIPYGEDEFERAGLEKSYSSVLPGDEKNPVPMVKSSPVRFECEYHSTVRLPGNPPMGTVDIVIGRVVGVHIDDHVLTDGKLDVRKTEPIARCGYYEYAVVRETFEMVIPGMDEGTLAGLEGSSKRHKALPTNDVQPIVCDSQNTETFPSAGG